MKRRDTSPPPGIAQVWQRIRLSLIARRERIGLSQYHLGVQAGMSRSQITEYENGTHTPSVALLIRWAETLDYRLGLEDIAEDSDLRRVRRDLRDAA